MAVIGTIRKRSGLLIFLIGLAIVGFIVMDFTQSQSSILRGRNDSVGKVNGEKLNINEFNQKVDENVKNYESRMGSMDDNVRNMLKNQTWNDMVNQVIFGDIYNKLGLTVTNAELGDLFTSMENAAPEVKNAEAFRDPNTGQFSPSMVRMYSTPAQLDQDPPGAEQGARRREWASFENSIEKRQQEQKYMNLISKALIVPGWMAEMAYNDQMRQVDFKYVALPYSDVNDADIKVSDEDLKNYLQSHKAKFTQDEETRRIQFVAFDINPSAADTAKTILALEAKREEFAQGVKASDDSIFVNIYSETRFDDVYYDKDNLNSPIKDSLFKVPVKTVIGPYLDGSSYKIAKVSDRKMISDSVHIREIVISFAGVTQETAPAKYKLIDSIFRQIDSLKGDFAMFAFQYSDDPMTKMRGGDAGWIKQGERQDKYLNNLLFYRAQKGKTYVAGDQKENVFRIFQVIEDRPSKMGVQVAYLTQEVVPSEETQKNIYATATGFAADNHEEAKFKEAAKKMNVKTADIRKDEFNISQAGAGSAREVIKWAFDAKTKKGQVSSIFPLDKKHVVAMLVDISPKGLPSLEAVREQVKAEVIKDKKVELLAKKIADAKASSADELAAKLGKPAQQADKVSFGNPNLNGMSSEPAVVAAALGTPAGKLSGGIAGNSGVYAVQTIAITEPPKTTDYSMFAMQLKQQLQSKANYVQDVQRKLADIKDNRAEFF